ncbi:hypothetical protein A3C37_04200 [Candidatus Peribacteria bacterium RIFCSPHIGHO2_02_FULL_53_20]|nr:MAG: hypothetical protein A3C37_04200 [Candidatus Peribacteria bacterium RIFCSPHIGHO2_02_FULL_53_20]OGJ66956.1 MAG: hypothetical protein A3B61_03055 [Candidatus Peribacteria bacterium RIFCSPLOWO2_01_FULL_53_10]
MNSYKKNPRVYLDDILGAIARVTEYTSQGKQQFFDDMKTQDAVIRQISIIGEASSRLPKNLRDAHSGIPWKEIIGMRNIIVHDYSHTDLIIVWDTIQQHLPALKENVDCMLRETP